MKHIFVWTLDDVLGLIFLGGVLIFAGCIGLKALWESAKEWARR